jgi:hypothetical protein
VAISVELTAKSRFDGCPPSTSQSADCPFGSGCQTIGTATVRFSFLSVGCSKDLRGWSRDAFPPSLGTSSGPVMVLIRCWPAAALGGIAVTTRLE